MALSVKLGALLLGLGALLWAADSARYGDVAEMVWCGLVGVGWLGFAAGLWLSGRARVLASGAGLLVAAVAATHWMLDAGSPTSSWTFYGVGMEAAAVAALLFWSVPAWRARVAWAFPLAFAAVLVAGAKLALGDLAADWLNAGAVVLTLVGAALVTVRRGATYERLLAPSAA